MESVLKLICDRVNYQQTEQKPDLRFYEMQGQENLPLKEIKSS